jgi:hypothetical protein
MKQTSRGVLTGMIFSNILYFILLATGVTLHDSGQTEIETAAQAAAALEPVAVRPPNICLRPASSASVS